MESGNVIEGASILNNVLLVMPHNALRLGDSLAQSAASILPAGVALSRQILPADLPASKTGWGDNGWKREARPHSVLLCLEDSAVENAATFRHVQNNFRETPIIIAANADSAEQMFGLLRLGAADFMLAPFRPLDLLVRLWRFRSETSATHQVVRDLKERFGLEHLVG